MEDQSAYTKEECGEIVGAYLDIIEAAFSYSKNRSKNTKKDLEAYCRRFKEITPLNLRLIRSVSFLRFIPPSSLDIIAKNVVL